MNEKSVEQIPETEIDPASDLKLRLQTMFSEHISATYRFEIRSRVEAKTVTDVVAWERENASDYIGALYAYAVGGGPHPRHRLEDLAGLADRARTSGQVEIEDFVELVEELIEFQAQHPDRQLLAESVI